MLYLALSAGAADSDTWPGYRGYPNLLGTASGDLSDSPAPLWHVKLGGPASVQPVTDGSTVYAVTDNGRVTAVTLNGKPVWTQALTRISAETGKPAPEQILAPPLVIADTFVAGSDSGRIHALHADNGKPQWTADLDGGIQGAVSWAPAPSGTSQQILAMVRPSGSLHAFALKTGRALWKSRPTARCDGSFAVADNRIVFGNCDAALHAFAADAGKRLARIPLCDDCQVAAGVALLGPLAYVGTRSGRIYAADIAKNTLLWTNTVSRASVFTTPAIDRHDLVVAAEDGTVYALNRNSGAVRWKTQTADDPASPILTPTKVILAADGRLFVLRRTDGRTLWSREISDSISAPAIVHGRLFLTADDGTLNAFGTPITSNGNSP